MIAHSTQTTTPSGLVSAMRLSLLLLIFLSPAVASAQTDQTITLGDITSVKVSAGAITLPAKSSANLDIVYTSSDPSVATVSGNVLTPVAPGVTFIRANQPGDVGFNPAPEVIKVFTVLNDLPNEPGKGHLWGMAGGGSQGLGVIFRTDPDGNNFHVAHDFISDSDGAGVGNGGLTEYQGKLYGVASGGGTNNLGVLFDIDMTTHEYTVRHNFTTSMNDFGSNGQPIGNLILFNDKLYGWTGDGSGYIFEFDPATDAFTKKTGLTGVFGASGSMVLLNGKIYGGCLSGNASDYGGIMEYVPGATTMSVKHNFTLAEGGRPTRLTVVDGRLFGTTSYGAANGNGGVFEMDILTGDITVYYSFTDSPNGSLPLTYANGSLYGMHYRIVHVGQSTSVEGIIFAIDLETKTYSVPYVFPGNGAGDHSTLAMGADGRLYGVVRGDANKGQIIAFDPVTDEVEMLRELTTPDGLAAEYTSSMFASDGNLYVLTPTGGQFAKGTCFQFDLASEDLTVLKSFYLGLEGIPTSGEMTLGNDGKLYGAAENGANGFGTFYSWDPKTGVFHGNFHFDETNRNLWSRNPFAETSDGKFYYISEYSYPDPAKLIEYDREANTLVTKYEFNEDAKGVQPVKKLTYVNGGLFGITKSRGGLDKGTIFRYDLATGQVSNLYDLDSETGTSPGFGFILMPDGTLLATTNLGGANDKGIVFSFNPLTEEVKGLVDLNDQTAGMSVLTPGPNGHVFSVTSSGGAALKGTIIQFIPSDGFNDAIAVKRKDLDGSTGYLLFSPIVASNNGKLYASTYYSGNFGPGVLLEFDPAAGTITNKHQFTDTGDNYIGPPFNLSFVPSDRSNQTITFEDPADLKFSDAPVTLEATATSGLAVQFTSSDESIIKIVDGKMVPMALGNATIKADQAGNGEFEYAASVSQEVEVKRGDHVITFETVTTKTVGDAPFELVVSDSKGIEVEVTSSSLAISINGLTATIMQPGSVTLTAKAKYNANYTEAAEVMQTICVNAPKPTITIFGENTENFTLTSSAFVGNQWYKDGHAIDGAIDRDYKPTTEGIYQVAVVIEDCVSELSDEVPVLVTGLENKEGATVRFYPNPVTDKLSISIPGNQGSHVTVIDSRGASQTSLRSNTETTSIDVQSYRPGLYFIKVQRENGGSEVLKMIKK